MLLASLLLLAAPLQAAGPPPPGGPDKNAPGPADVKRPAAPAAPYNLQGNATNTGNTVTYFTTNSGSSLGGWQFQENTSSGTALRAICPIGSNCWGIYSTGISRGVYATVSDTNGIGVYGSTALSGSGTGTGVYGKSTVSDGAGVYGKATGTGINSAGVKGEGVAYGGLFTGALTNTKSIGVFGSGAKYGGSFLSGATGLLSQGTAVGVLATTVTGTVALRAQNTLTDSLHYAIIADGNVQINGNYVATGTKSASVATSQGTRLMYAEESTTNLFSDQGTATLKNGRVVIPIDPLYAQTVNLPAGYQVFVTPNSAETLGLAVINETGSSFEVRELGKGIGSFRFHWRISALRRGYEKTRMAPAPVVPVDQPRDDSARLAPAPAPSK